MAEIRETNLPGVGVGRDFECRTGRRLGVITRITGRRQLVVYDTDDPDAAAESVDLSEGEAQLLGELLGGPSRLEREGSLGDLIEGLAVDWLRIPRQSPSRTIEDLAIRTATGASIVAIVRDGTAIPAPGPDDELRGGDTAVVVGTPDGIRAAAELLGG